MARVFVSHASEDGEYARQLREWLGGRHEVFLDQDPGDGIRLGEEWRQRLHEQLRRADAVVCVVTSAFLGSPWCNYEVGYAQSRGSRLLPIRAEAGVVHPVLRFHQDTGDLTRDPGRARTELLAALLRIETGGGAGWPDDRCPFPGLRPLDTDWHQVFFGRSEEVHQLAELLRSPAEHANGAVLLVVGPSGCGKSSLVRAGLLPVMAAKPDWWTLEPMLPGANPVSALARELALTAQQRGLDWTAAKVGHRLDDGGLTGLVDELLPKAHARRLLLVVDQFEELLTQSQPGERARFAQLLRSALDGPLQVVATLRPEFFEQLLLDPELAVLPTHIYQLRPLRREALRTVIEGPAQLAGIGVGEDLVTRLLDDTDSGEALPLLALTLAQLAEGISRGGQLSGARYNQLGGVQGALTRQADAALADASAVTGRRREDVIAGLLWLVTVDEQGRPTRWPIPRERLPEPVTQELEAFITRRLVITDREKDTDVVRVAHKAFLSAWKPLVEAIKENASALRARREVEQAAAEWKEEGHPPARLWERRPLAAALADIGANPNELSPTAWAFLRASIRRDRLRRGRAITVLSVALVITLLAAVIIITLERTVKRQRDVALSQKVAGQARGLRATDPALAAQLGLAAYRLDPTTEARGSLLSTFAAPYATQLTGHTNGLTRLAFNPDGRILATASADNTVRLWGVSNPHHPRPLGILTGHTNEVWAVAFSPDGDTLATGSKDGTARLWDVSDPRHPSPLATLTGHTDTVYSVAFSPDRRTLATGNADNTVQLWGVSDPHHPTPLTTLTGHAGVYSAAFSPDGHTLATGCKDGTTQLWDVSDPRHPHALGTLTSQTDIVWSVAFSPDGHTLATASADKTAKLWDVSDPRHPTLLAILPSQAGVYTVAFSPDGHTLATAGDDHTARVWDISDPHHPNLLATLTGHTNMVWSVAFSPDGRTLVTGSADNTARLWDLPGPVMAGHTDSVRSVAFSSDGHTLATASNDTTARLWDISDPNHPRSLGTLTGHTGSVRSVTFSPDGRTVATASNDRTARLWDISDPRQPHLLSTLTDPASRIFAVAFSPDGHTLATASPDSSARLWDVRDPRQPHLLSPLTGGPDGVFAVAFSPDGHTVATGSSDHKARLWDVRDPRQPHLLSTLTGRHANDVYSVAFSPDGHTLATGSADSTARLWDISNLSQPHLLSILSGHSNAVNSVALSPDGHTLATGSDDHTVRLWDVSNPHQPRLLAILTGHTNAIESVAFSPDGHTLATADADHTARLWDTSVDRVKARICRITPAITKKEWDHYLPGLGYRPPCR